MTSQLTMHHDLAWQYSLAVFWILTFTQNLQVVAQVQQNDRQQPLVWAKYGVIIVTVAPLDSDTLPSPPLPSSLIPSQFLHIVMALHLNPVSLQITKNLEHTVLLIWVAKKIFLILFTFFFLNSPSRMGTENPKYIPFYLWQLVLGMQSYWKAKSLVHMAKEWWTPQSRGK